MSDPSRCKAFIVHLHFGVNGLRQTLVVCVSIFLESVVRYCNEATGKCLIIDAHRPCQSGNADDDVRTRQNDSGIHRLPGIAMNKGDKIRRWLV